METKEKSGGPEKAVVFHRTTGRAEKAKVTLFKPIRNRKK
jgi:hypothetical protein